MPKRKPTLKVFPGPGEREDVPMSTGQAPPSEVARRVLIVEDDAFTRSLMAHALESAGFDVTTAATPAEAAHEFSDIDPDAVLVDIHLGEGVSGVDLANRFRAEAPWLALIVVSNYPNQVSAGLPRQLPEDAAFVNKASVTDAAALLQVVEDTLRNQGSIEVSAEESPIASLSSAQIAMLRMLAMGWSNAEIAKRRGSTLRSVERMVHKVFTELGLTGDTSINPRVEAVKMYVSVFGLPSSEEGVGPT